MERALQSQRTRSKRVKYIQETERSKYYISMYERNEWVKELFLSFECKRQNNKLEGRL